MTIGRFKKSLTKKGMGKSGKWKADSKEGKIVMASFDTLFKKFGATGVLFYFIDVLRKTLFTIFLAVVPVMFDEKTSPKVQLSLSILTSFGQFVYRFFNLPFNKMADNLNEINVMGTQIMVLVPAALGPDFLNAISSDDVNGFMMMFSFVSIGYVVMRQMKALLVDPVLAVFDKAGQMAAKVVPAEIEMTAVTKNRRMSELGGAGHMVEELLHVTGEVVGESFKKIKNKAQSIMKDAIAAYQTTFKETSLQIVTDSPRATIPDPIEVSKKAHATAVKAASDVMKQGRENKATTAKDHLKNAVGDAKDIAAEVAQQAVDEAIANIKAAVKEMVLEFCDEELIPVVKTKIADAFPHLSVLGGDKIANIVNKKFEASFSPIIER